jgi:hypothetical protein
VSGADSGGMVPLFGLSTPGPMLRLSSVRCIGVSLKNVVFASGGGQRHGRNFLDQIGVLPCPLRSC